jgi:hypothetical protein
MNRAPSRDRDGRSGSQPPEVGFEMDKIEGFLEVGRNENHEVVINHPDLKPDENGVGHIVFSPRQARNLANLLLKHATWAEAEAKGQRSPYEGITGGG